MTAQTIPPHKCNNCGAEKNIEFMLASMCWLCYTDKCKELEQELKQILSELD